MNRTKVNRVVLAGIVTLLVFIIVETIVESVIGRALFGSMIEGWYLKTYAISKWSVANHVLNIFISWVICATLAWLYAALRLMFGVGTKTALITSAFSLFFLATFYFNFVNLGIIPLKIVLIDLGYSLIEIPIAITVGARAYEGR
jgi:hypothetical protein